MPAVEITCAECGHTLQVEEAVLGTTLKCPKCKFDFVAETGDAYDLADDQFTEFTSEPAGLPLSVENPAKSAPKARPETEAERKLRERMERWAED